MRRYNNNDRYYDRDYSTENSVDNYDMRSYTPRNGYHNMDYDDSNWWQPEEEYEYESRANNNNDYDISETRRHRHLRPLGIRRRVDNNEGERRSSDYSRNESRRNYSDSNRSSSRRNNNAGRDDNYYNEYDRDSGNRSSRSGMSNSARRREYDYQNEGYGGRNANDYNNNYDRGYYYNPDDYNGSDVRNRNEYEYADYDDDGTRRRKRWSEDYDYYQSVPSYRRSDDDYLEPTGNEKSFSRKNSRRERMDREDDERGSFSDRRHDFGYYADDRYDDYPRRRPNIRDSKY